MDETLAGALAPALAQLAALADDANITRAAERTGTSQPTLSRSVRSWETVLGIALVRRRGRGIELTDDGRLVATAAREALQVLETAIGRARGAGHPSSLTVGFLRSLGPTVAGELIASFLTAAPGTVIVHREGSSADLTDGLGAGQLDLVITAPRPPLRFGWLPLGRQNLVLVVPTGHRLAHRDRLDLREARDESFLALDARFDTRERAEALCASAGFEPRIILEADSLTTVRGYVAVGLGVAILPADGLPNPRTANIPIDSPDAWRPFGLSWAQPQRSTAAARFVEHAGALGLRYPGWADILS